MKPSSNSVTTMLLAMATTLSCATAPPAPPPPAPPPPPPALDGDWLGVCERVALDDGTDGYVQQSLAIGAGAFKRIVRFHSDEKCSLMTGELWSEGTLRMGGVRSDGGYDLDYDVMLRSVLAYEVGFNAFLQALDCGRAPYKVKVAQPLQDGCAPLGVPPAQPCPMEYDVVRSSAGGLQFGVRPKDGEICSAVARPSAYAPVMQTKALPPG